MNKIFIGTNIGGTLETIIDEKTGFLAPYNNIRGFASVLNDVMNISQEKAEKIGLKARDSVLKNFAIDKMYNSLVKIYNNITKSK